MKRQRLNDMKMEAARANNVYLAVIIDLANAGIIDKSKAENLVGFKFNASLKGSSFSKDINAPAAKVASKKATSTTEEASE